MRNYQKKAISMLVCAVMLLSVASLGAGCDFGDVFGSSSSGPDVSVPDTSASVPDAPSQPEVSGTSQPPSEAPAVEWALEIEGVPGVTAVDSAMMADILPVTLEITTTNSVGVTTTRVYTGIPLNAILEKIGVTGVASVTFVASDGFSADISNELAMADDTLIAWERDGELLESIQSAVGQGSSGQNIRGLAKIIIDTGENAAIEWTIAIEGVAGVTEITSEMASSITPVTIEMARTNSSGVTSVSVFTGILLKDALELIGVTGVTSLTAASTDGFTAVYNNELAMADDTVIAWLIDGEPITGRETPLRLAPNQGTGNQYVWNFSKLIIG